MGIPRDKDAKRFFLVAGRRFEDAEWLFEGDRTRGAMYLAGYCVECLLKALILTQAPKNKRSEAFDEFRGSGAHSFDRLRSQYRKYGGPKFPKDVVDAFLIVQEWGTDWRYDPAAAPADDADEFLNAVRTIRQRATGRL